MKMEIEDRCHRESTLVVTITTPKDGMMYDDEVVQRSVKHLVDELSKTHIVRLHPRFGRSVAKET
jgi:hypothetical protein